MNRKPLVSVCCLTYNHEPFIERCIEGFLMQDVDFPYEVIIAEDCSTDGTRAICEKFAAAYPEVIKLLPSVRNLGPKENERRLMTSVRGKYIAFCEGDDYWTDDQKLKKQVCFLKSNPEYSVCFTRCLHKNAETGIVSEDACGNLFSGEDGVDVTMEMFFGKWITQPLTMVYRADAIDLDLYDRYEFYRDHHQIYHLLKSGKGYLFSFISGVRIVHTGGVASTIDSFQYYTRSLPLMKEFYEQNREDPMAKKNYVETLQLGSHYFASCSMTKKAISLLWEQYRIDHSEKALLKNILFLLRR